MTTARSGPLAGLKVVELAGLGPAPFATMFLADLGAEVVRVERPSGGFALPVPPEKDALYRGKAVVEADLTDPDGRAAVADLIGAADVLVDGFRPGVMERQGLGPGEMRCANPRLVYARMTGWGQDGPLAQRAGHDPTYLALTGALHAIGEAGGAPVMPLNLVGDFGGGGMYLVAGILAALLERTVSGQGQVVDVSIVDGVNHLMASTRSMLSAGQWTQQRGANTIDGAAPFTAAYRTADGEYMVVAALEEKFYAELVRGLGLDAAALPNRWQRANWPELKETFARRFATRTRADWTAVFEGVDACVAPVLSMSEAVTHPHNAARHAFIERDGVTEPAPAPRFSRTPGAVTSPRWLPSAAGLASVAREWKTRERGAGQ
jgi:alpha-methylacyl-CoA racemase